MLRDITRWSRNDSSFMITSWVQKFASISVGTRSILFELVADLPLALRAEYRYLWLSRVKIPLRVTL